MDILLGMGRLCIIETPIHQSTATKLLDLQLTEAQVASSSYFLFFLKVGVVAGPPDSSTTQITFSLAFFALCTLQMVGCIQFLLPVGFCMALYAEDMECQGSWVALSAAFIYLQACTSHVPLWVCEGAEFAARTFAKNAQWQKARNIEILMTTNDDK